MLIPFHQDNQADFAHLHPDLPRIIGLHADRSLSNEDVAIDLFVGISCDLPVRFIKIGGKPYLERYFLGAHQGQYAYLHRFVSADGDRHVHSHPWVQSQSLILTGMYRELRGQRRPGATGLPPITERVYRRGGTNLLDQLSVHKIISIVPETWTLFMHTEWAHPWGYFDDEPGREGLFVEEEGESRNRFWWTTNPCGADADRALFQAHPRPMASPVLQ